MTERNNNRLSRLWHKASKKGRAGMLILGAFFLLLLFLLSAYSVGAMLRLPSGREHGALYYGVRAPGIWLTLGADISVLTAALLNELSFSKRNRVSASDERGVFYLEKGTHGTSRIATKEEKEVYFNIGDIEDTDEMVFAQETSNGKRVISYKRKEEGSPGTRHVLVFAPSGGGKTFTLVLPNLIQAVIRGESFIAVDPDASLFGRLALFCRNRNVETKILNLANIDYSESWDCLAETVDSNTGRVNARLIQSWSQIFMRNSQKQQDEDFWYQGALNLLESVIGFAAWRRESYILEGYKSLFNHVSRGVDADKYEEILNKTFIDFPWCEQKIYETALKNGFEAEYIASMIAEIHEKAPPFTLREVYEIVNNFSLYEKKFELIPERHPGSISYKRFARNSKDVVKESAVQGAQMKFKIFDDEKLLTLLSSKGMDFSLINRRQSAYFLAVPDNDTIMQPVASLFFSFFFRDAQRNYDEEANRARAEQRENRCIPVLAMMDEFASLGVITGDEAMFGTIMSDVRKREITNFIICQYYSQLELNYGRYVKNGIIANCGTMLCLGANDQETKEEVSKATGTATVMKESHYQSEKGIFGSRPLSGELSASSVSRPVFTPDEVGRLDDEVLIIRRGCDPFKANPFPWTEHPAYINGECPASSYFALLKKNGEDPWLAYDRQHGSGRYRKLVKDETKPKSLRLDGTTGEIIEDNRKEKRPRPLSKDRTQTAKDKSTVTAVRRNSASALDD